jgi:NADPH2:quinone reductase
MLAGVASPDGLVITECEIPTPSAEQVLVRVRAAGLNRADLLAARGMGVASADSFGKPIGMEWAGEVVEIGPGVLGCRIGHRVACSGTGGYAEYAVADQHRLFRLGDDMDLFGAAVLPLALMTAYDAFDRAGFQAGETVLVRGASSGIGLAAMQVAKLLGAARVIATSRSPDRRGRLGMRGADDIVDHSVPGWAASVLEQTMGAGAEVVIDMVGGVDIDELMKATAIAGRIVNVGRLGGATASFDLNLHALRRIAFFGATFRTRSLAEVRRIVAGVADTLWSHVERGALSLPIDRRFDLADAGAAQAHMAANRHFGKIALAC